MTRAYEIAAALREYSCWAEYGEDADEQAKMTDELCAAADLIENQQRHIEALMKANESLKDDIARRDKQIEDMKQGMAQLTKAVAVKEEKQMDAVKFIEERKRMCEAHAGCPGCPAFRGVDACIFSVNTSASSSEQVELVEDWSIAHPRKTRQSVFLEQYPNARIDSQAVIYVCPADAYGDKVCPKNEENVHMPCCDCRKEFWSQEVE